MANIIQKIFLSKKKLAKIDQEQEILNLVSAERIYHRSYITESGCVIRNFTVATKECNIKAERCFNPANPEEKQIRFSVVYAIAKPMRVKYATNNEVDKFAQTLYVKMRNKWEKNNQNVK